MAHGLTGTFVVAVTGKADADHLGPVIWKLAVDGESVRVVTTTDAAHRAIETAWWTAECPTLQLTRIRSQQTRLGRRFVNLGWNRWRLKRWLKSHDTCIVLREWGEGVSATRPTFLRRLLRYWFTDVSLQLLLAARELGLPTVALPHGHSTKTTIIKSRHVQGAVEMNEGKLPFADRDSYAAYVFCSTYHRDAIVKSSTMNGANAVAWGSARFNDDWVSRLYRHSRSATLPNLHSGEIRRVLFFLPKWQNLINRPETIRLVATLAATGRVQLVVRGHLRSEAALIDDAERAQLQNPHLVFVSDDVSSSSLIKSCEVVVDVDSSIAFDAVLLGKPYVRPRYLQDASVRTIWDELGGAHQTDSLEATIELLTADLVVPAGRDRTFDQVVFGGSGAEVLARYRDRLREIVDQSRV